MTTVTLTGDKALDKKLSAMPTRLRNKAMRQACRVVAKLVHTDARQKVPRKSGDLAKSLVVRAAKRSRKHKHQVAVTVRTKDGFFQGDQFYGGFLEFGTAERQTKAGASRGRVPQFKFLRNALYSFPETKRQIFVNHIRSFIKAEEVKSVS